MTHKTRPERRRLARIRQANWIKTYKKATGIGRRQARRMAPSISNFCRLIDGGAI